MVYEIATLAGLVVIAGGMIGAWVRNGKSQAKRDEQLAGKTDEVLRRLNDEDTGLSALNEKVSAFRLHCEGVSTALTGRIATAERDIAEFKTGRKP